MSPCFHRVAGALAAALLASSPVTHAQTVASGPYYATPSWDQKLACESPANCPRFIVLSNWNNDAVLDRETGLVWERTPSQSVLAWSPTKNACRQHTTGGRYGWRLPTIEELFTLKDPAATVPPFLPPGHPFAVEIADYWSINTSAANTDAAWAIRLSVPFGQQVAAKTDLKYAWCVRGGQSIDPQ